MTRRKAQSTTIPSQSQKLVPRQPWHRWTDEELNLLAYCRTRHWSYDRILRKHFPLFTESSLWGLIAVSLPRSVHTVRRFSLVQSPHPALPLETKILHVPILYRKQTIDLILPLSQKPTSEFINLLPQGVRKTTKRQYLSMGQTGTIFGQTDIEAFRKARHNILSIAFAFPASSGHIKTT